jgi:hypothetical protein
MKSSKLIKIKNEMHQAHTGIELLYRRQLIQQMMYQKFTVILITGAQAQCTKLSSLCEPRIVELIAILYTAKLLLSTCPTPKSGN